MIKKLLSVLINNWIYIAIFIFGGIGFLLLDRFHMCLMREQNLDVCLLLGKSAWDWLDKLLAPFILALAGISVNRIFKSRDDKRLEQEKDIAEDRKNQEVLKDYFDDTHKLLSEGKWFEEDKENEPIFALARARTLVVLKELDGKRKGSLIRFLSEAELLEFVSLAEADLEKADLRECRLAKADFTKANLKGADLRKCDLARSKLIKADLTGANLEEACIRKANLYAAILHKANLKKAKLCGAKLFKADMRKTNLTDANLVKADLRKANLSNADFNNATLNKACFGYNNDINGTRSLKVKNLTPKQIKSSCNWQGMKFNWILRMKLKSEPDPSINCSLWNAPT